MAVVVQSSTLNPGSTATVTGNKPAGTADGNLLLAFIAISQSITITVVPTDWNLEIEQVQGTNVRTAVYSKIADAEGASWNWTLSGAANSTIHVLRLDGQSTVSAYINIVGGQGNVASVSIVAPSVTTTVANCLLIGAFHTVGAFSTISPAGGMTEITDGQSGGGSRALETAYQALGAAGATGTRTATATVSAANVGVLLAIAPDPTGGSSALLFRYGSM